MCEGRQKVSDMWGDRLSWGGQGSDWGGASTPYPSYWLTLRLEMSLFVKTFTASLENERRKGETELCISSTLGDLCLEWL